MPTAQKIIETAYRKIGVLGRGRSLPQELLDSALEELQDMIRNWSTEHLLIPELRLEEFTLTVGEDRYNITSDAPLRVEEASIRDSSNTDFEIDAINAREYERVGSKTENARPTRLLYFRNATQGIVRLLPPPDKAYTLRWWVLKTLTAPDALGTSTSFPEEYNEALKYNLAVRLAPENGREVKPSVAAIATSSKRNIKRQNHRPGRLQVDKALLPERGRGSYNIDADQ